MVALHDSINIRLSLLECLGVLSSHIDECILSFVPDCFFFVEHAYSLFHFLCTMLCFGQLIKKLCFFTLSPPLFLLGVLDNLVEPIDFEDVFFLNP